MDRASGIGEDWDRKEHLAAELVDFLEGWVMSELSFHFLAILDAAFVDTAEHRLLSVLLNASMPMTLAEIATGCHVSKELLYPNGRLRRVLDRLERRGMIIDKGSAGRPRLLVNRGDRRIQLITKLFQEPRKEGLVTSSLRDVLGP